MEEAHLAHVLVVPYPVQGHINPMLQFSKRLISKGISATLALTVYLSNSVHVDPTSSIIDIDTFSDGYDEGGIGQAESATAYQTSLRVVGSETLASLIRKLDGSGRHVDAVIYDGFMPWYLDVAKELGKLGIVFFTQTCAVNNIYYHAKKGLLELPLKADTKVSVPGLPPLDPSETPSLIHNHFRSYPVLYDMVVDQFSNVEEADFVLVNTFNELEKEVANWMSANLWPLKTIGPMVPSMYLDRRLEADRDYSINLYNPDKEACSTWLAHKPPGSVIYVSFGSFASLSPDQMAELAAALTRQAETGRRSFLWIVRESELSKLPPDFITMTSSSSSGLIQTWCSQLEVLSHEAVGCFVTHCGLNSVHEALSLGVPLVAVPQWSDQPTNAKYVEDVWGVGVRVRSDTGGLVTRATIELCIQEVMEGEKAREIKKRARKWRELAIEAVGEGGSSDKNIDEFATKLVFSHKI